MISAAAVTIAGFRHGRTVAAAMGDGCVAGVALGAFAAEDQRAAMFAESFWIGGIDGASHLNFFRAGFFGAHGGENALGSEGRFAQADAHGIVDGIGDRRSGWNRPSTR